MPSPKKLPENLARDSLSVELGSWFKAHATGAGVIAIPVIVVLVVVLAAVQSWPR